MTTEIMELSTRTWETLPVSRRNADGWFDVTKMCKSVGDRQFFDYQKTTRGAEYIKALASFLEVSSVVHVTRGGSLQGTWVHPRVAIDVARWLSPHFAVWIDGWVLDFTFSVSPPLEVPALLEDHRLYQDQFVMRTELQLHEKVVKFIRKRYPGLLLMPGLGETGTTSEVRLANWRKGYQAGSPDLLVVHRHPKFTGLALEFKHPGGLGTTSELQTEFLNAMKSQGLMVMISQSYDDIIIAVADYMRDASVVCPECRKCFTSLSGLGNHVRTVHRKKRGRDEPPEEGRPPQGAPGHLSEKQEVFAEM
jgi:hypothetical protein